MTPRLLDLFCGAGGAGMGYHLAGFEVVGVDLSPQPTYPFRFIRANALKVDLSGFDAIHASPPCQAHTTMSNRYRGKGGKADSHADLIAPIRIRLIEAGVPYVIENVLGARRLMHNPITLWGGSFGLRVDRPRLFESNISLAPPARVKTPNPVGVYGKSPDGRLLWRRKDGSELRAARSVAEAREVMQMPWADWRGIAEAIPPAYTRWIGRQILAEFDDT